MRVPKARSQRPQDDITPRLERPPAYKTLWVAYALHLLGGCMIGLHRIYLGKPDVVPYLIGWFALTFFMLIANPGIAVHMLNGYMVFIFSDLVFIPGMVRRKNAELDAAYERRIAEPD